VTHEAVPWDLVGWGEIASALGVSVATARRYEHEDPPLPVSRFRGRAVASKHDVAEWVARHTQGPREGTQAPEPVVSQVWRADLSDDERS